MGAYSGAVTRASYSRRPPVAGVDMVHAKKEPGPNLDPFQPKVEDGPGTAGTVWDEPVQTERQSGVPNRAVLPTTHWWPTPDMPPTAVPDGYTRKQLDQSTQNRRNQIHSFADVIPNSLNRFRPFGLGKQIEWELGRVPRDAGRSAGELPWLANGRNGYDQTNGTTIVYSGDAANAGRYRVGYTQRVFGIFARTFAKNGQDVIMRAAENQHAELNHGREVKPNALPTTTTILTGRNTDPGWHWRAPSAWAAQSATAITDHSMLATTTPANPDFDDTGAGEYL
jgi:hypothetical protein